MSERTTIIKQRRRHSFVQVPNETVRDPRLSWKATGLLCYLLSLPDDWKIRLSHLSTEKKDRRDGTRAGLAELETMGYLRISTLRDDAKRIIGTVWEVSDFPDTENPNTEKPKSGKPTLQIQSKQIQKLKKPQPQTKNSGCSGGEKKRTPTRKIPVLVAAEEEGVRDAGLEKQNGVLAEVRLAECCKRYQHTLELAVHAANLDCMGAQKLADALAGALLAPEGSPCRLIKRNSPEQWMHSTAAAIATGTFIETPAFLSAVSDRQARQEVERTTAKVDLHRKRLDESAAAIQASINGDSLGVQQVGNGLLARSAAKVASRP